ncbi:hypothetical protein TRV_04233 [Trichophyton verrucosum HKI 0517]|uniref:Major facilitator superfamily (MFS) profile domain-containing protein n=1 Tax=Trichophyton verrucosum (strain HKI 0517) TaxID=663202 RepID=D4DAT5_TRIVH|nr:uncharacterized protein TRV_04233 [Trichophyton verrucosum HKI 0517]EFE41035.1 hypothetical protein TRV_04233 [Trichophyton verrucosum HKI 0517]
MSASKLETSGVSAEISTPAGPGESDPEPISEKTEIEKGEIDAANDVETSPKKSLAFKLAFVGLASSLFVFQLDATALGIALPTIAADLGGQSLESFWANLSYTLCGIAMQPIWASISNAFGRKPPLYVCMTLFFVGSVVFAVAKNMNTIIIGRVLQGFGGGGIDVLVEVVIADMTTLQERSKYIGLMGIVLAIGNIMGPSVGALFATYASWRWIGWVNLPLLGIGMPLIYFFLKLRPVPLDKSLAKNLARLDWIGMTLVIVGITILVLPISWAGSLFPWSSWQTLVPMLLGFLVLAIFGFYEAKPAAPIMPHRLFHSKTANMTLAGGFIHGATLVSLLQYLPLIYQAVQLETPILSAVSLLPTVVTSVLLAATSMMMVPFFGGYVWLLRLSWIILTLGTGLLALLRVESTSSMRLGLPILWGAGVALLRLNLLPMQASVKKVDDTGLAIGLFLTIRPLLPLRDASNAVAFIEKLRSLDISPETLLPVLKVYLKCFQTIFYTMTGLGGLGFVTSIFIDEIALSGENLGNQRFEE